MQPFGSQPLGDAQRWKRGQLMKAPDSPSRQRFVQVGRGGEQRHRQFAQKFGFVPIRHDADARKRTRRENGGVGIGRDRNIDLETQFRRPASNRGGDILRHTEESIQSRSVERDGVGRGLFNRGAKTEMRASSDRWDML